MSRRIPTALVLMIASLCVVALLLAWVSTIGPGGPGDETIRIRVACAAGVKRPVEQAARDYEETYGVEVELLYGGSATLLGGIEIKPDSADLYIAADSSYVEDGRARGMLRESIPIATLTPVIAVAKGNPRSVLGLEDLVDREDLRIGLANPDAAAVGKAARSLLIDIGRWETFEDRLTVLKPTVVDVANDVVIGSLDASIVWDATTAQYEELQALRDPVLDQGRRTIEVAVVEATSVPTEALRFARYLAARDEGQLLFERFGYEPTVGDVWDERPKVVLFAGSMFNQAIEETVAAFSEREGVEVDRVYNGCGILTGQMKAGAQPDAYLSCDVRFLEEVGSRFHPALDISENPMVLITPRDNPGSVETIKDLLRPGTRVGLAHPEKSALGLLTMRLLEEQELLESMKSSGNWVQEAPQGDFLVNAMRTGALDAAIVYTSNAALNREHLEVIPIETGEIQARQPWAVSRTSDHQNTLGRLLDALLAEESAGRFKALGFNWLPSEQPNTVQDVR
ncbi:MAG: substrate-binding domain-containing protein [Phycisphaerales bacterium]|nr:substrate-binding domain-containing protein [Phycisphaerales bacterium]